MERGRDRRRERSEVADDTATTRRRPHQPGDAMQVSDADRAKLAMDGHWGTALRQYRRHRAAAAATPDVDLVPCPGERGREHGAVVSDASHIGRVFRRDEVP